MKHYKLVEFFSKLNVKPPCTNIKPSHTNVKPPYCRHSNDGSGWRPGQKTNSATLVEPAPPWSKFGAPMVKSEFFRRQIYCTVLKKVLVTLLGLFSASSSNSAPLQWFSAPIVNWRPGNCAPLVTPLARVKCERTYSREPLLRTIFFDSRHLQIERRRPNENIWTLTRPNGKS